LKKNFVYEFDFFFEKASTTGYHAIVFRAPIGEEIKNNEEIEKIVWNTWTR
jgi:hypothetical protein